MTDKSTVHTLEVARDRWAETRIVANPVDDSLAPDEVLFRVDRLALTANNISYASAGDTLGYWGFFPADRGWGRIPAMGWGEVIASKHADIQAGERVWGFFPYTTHLKIQAGKVSQAHFHDVSPYRAEYAPVYSQFDRACANPMYDSAREDQDSLLRGLFLTSWLVEDFLHTNDLFGATACLITSASSKTSVALAHQVKQRGALRSVGITSARNVAFCESLGCYDSVLTYDDVNSLDAAQPVVLVDMAGSAQVLGDLHRHYGDRMRHSCRIGMTHYDEAGNVEGLPGATPTFFFAPTHVKARSAQIGAAQLTQAIGTSFVGFRLFCDGWLRIEHSFGPQAVIAAYQAVLAGKANPATGQIVSMWPEGG